MTWKQDLTSLNLTGLILLLGSTIFSAIRIMILSITTINKML